MPISDPPCQEQIDDEVKWVLESIAKENKRFHGNISKQDDFKIRHLSLDLELIISHPKVVNIFVSFGKWNIEHGKFEDTPEWDTLVEELLRISPANRGTLERWKSEHSYYEEMITKLRLSAPSHVEELSHVGE